MNCQVCMIWAEPASNCSKVVTSYRRPALMNHTSRMSRMVGFEPIERGHSVLACAWVQLVHIVGRFKGIDLRHIEHAIRLQHTDLLFFVRLRVFHVELLGEDDVRGFLTTSYLSAQ